MSQSIIVLLGARMSDALRWALVVDGACLHVGDAGSLGVLADAIDGYDEECSVVAVLPGEQAALRALAAPPRQMSKLQSAARLLLEDELARPIEEHHIAVNRSEGAAQIVAVELSLMRDWFNAFRDAGVSLTAMTPDFSVLPGTRERGVLFIRGARVIGHFGDRAFATEADLAKLAIASFFEAAPGAQIGVYSPSETTLSESSRYERFGDGSETAYFELVAKAVAEDACVNLLQGEFRVKSRSAIDYRRWRRPAALAASLLALIVAGALADGYRANRLADRYERGAAAIYADAFPQTGEGMRAHARRVLGRGGGNASFLALSDVLGRALESHDNVSIDRVRFDQDRGAFVFSIRSNSDAEIAAFQASLSALGASASETGGYRRSGAFWVGDMTVTMS